MAGFEGPPDPGSGSEGATKLPSWAVTRAQPGPDDDVAAPPEPADPAGRGTFADVGPGRDAPQIDRPRSRVPEHPFDVDDPFGDNQLGGGSSPWIRPPADDSEVRVVDLADEFHLTTAQALEVCLASGTPASSGAAWLTVEQADAFRVAVASYDRSSPTDESYPAWAVPPGGSRPPLHRTADAEAVVPGAALLARATPTADDEPAGSGGRMRVILLIVALVAIAILVAMLLLR